MGSFGGFSLGSAASSIQRCLQMSKLEIISIPLGEEAKGRFSPDVIKKADYSKNVGGEG